MTAAEVKILITLSTQSWDLEKTAYIEALLYQIYKVWASSEALRMFLSNYQTLSKLAQLQVLQ